MKDEVSTATLMSLERVRHPYLVVDRQTIGTESIDAMRFYPMDASPDGGGCGNFSGGGGHGSGGGGHGSGGGGHGSGGGAGGEDGGDDDDGARDEPMEEIIFEDDEPSETISPLQMLLEAVGAHPSSKVTLVVAPTEWPLQP